MIPTNDLVAQLRGLGLHSSPELLRQDVLRGLIAPSMPAADLPGRGHPSDWSPMAVRRARYLARLRRRSVDGRVLPLLAFIWDGWGWATIAPTVASALRRTASLDRRSLRADRIRDKSDLEDRAAQGASDADPAHAGPILAAREYILSAVLTGRPLEGSSPIGFAMLLGQEVAPLLGESATDEELESEAAKAERIAAARRTWGATPSEVADWLLAIDLDAAERGRAQLHEDTHQIRRFVRASGQAGSSNALTWCATNPTDLRRLLRATTGRPTPSFLLATCIAQEIFTAELRRRAGLVEST